MTENVNNFTLGGLEIIDITNRSNPIRKALLPLPGPAYEIDLRDNRAYVAVESQGLAIVDISNPNQPQVIETFDTPGKAMGVSVENDTVNIADGDGGVWIYGPPPRPATRDWTEYE